MGLLVVMALLARSHALSVPRFKAKDVHLGGQEKDPRAYGSPDKLASDKLGLKRAMVSQADQLVERRSLLRKFSPKAHLLMALERARSGWSAIRRGVGMAVRRRWQAAKQMLAKLLERLAGVKSGPLKADEADAVSAQPDTPEEGRAPGPMKVD